MQGTIVKSTGKFYEVLDSSTQKQYPCVIRGKFKLDGHKLTNPVAVGDKVEFSWDEATGLGIIHHIHDRINYVVRQSPRKKHNLHLLAANIDQALVIVTIINPMLKQGFIDRFLLMTEPYNIPVTIVFNKCDLWDNPQWELYQYLKNIYTPIGYECLATSVHQAETLSLLRTKIDGKISLLAGQSGVGKSSLINQIIPTLNLKTQSLSSYSGKGQHTTTFAEMHTIDSDTAIIDTPGIKNLSFNHLEPMDIAHNFREIFTTSQDCKFDNCTHRNEPKCAVKDAIANEEISELRYLNYLQIIEESEEQNYWERITQY